MRTHLKVIAVINIVMGGLGVLGGLAMILGFPLFGLVDAEAFLPMALVGLVGGLFAIAFALPPIICGIGLLALKPWARIGTIVLSVISLFGFPVGTLFGAYSLWALFSNETRHLIGEQSSF